MLYNRLLQMVKRSFLVSKQNDNTTVPTINISALGNNTISEVVYPYGYYAVAPEKSQSLSFNILAQENNQASIVYDNLSRHKGLDVGEVIVGSQIANNTIKFSNNGDIKIKNDTSQVNLTSSEISLTRDSGSIVLGDSNIKLSFGSTQLIITGTEITSNVNIIAPNIP